MSRILSTLMLLLVGWSLFAQETTSDSIADRLSRESDDQARLDYLLVRAKNTSSKQPSLGISYATRAVEYATSLGLTKAKADGYIQLGNCYRTYAVSSKSLESYIHALELYLLVNYSMGIGLCHNNIGILHLDEENFPKSIEHLLDAQTYFTG